jgi:RNA polymerase sigma factor (TIGR02999 family)
MGLVQKPRQRYGLNGELPVTDTAAAEISSARGDARPGNSAFQQLYQELHSMAHRQLHRSMSPAGLNTTALVHEAYLRVAGAGTCNFVDGEHFLAYAANVMRSVIVDIMRAHRAEKRGSGAAPLTLNTDVVNAMPSSEDEVLRIHDALLELESIDGILVRVVEMRYFAGLSEEEIAEAMDISTRTVRRHWQKARLFLRETLSAAR